MKRIMQNSDSYSLLSEKELVTTNGGIAPIVYSVFLLLGQYLLDHEDEFTQGVIDGWKEFTHPS